MARKWEGKSRGGSFGYLFFIRLLRTFGLGAAYAFLGLVVLYFIPFAPSQTASSWKYARRILGMSRFRSAAFLVRSYYAFGKSLIDKIATGSGMTDEFSFEFENHDLILGPVKAGCGCIAIGAHVGSWQMGTPFFGQYGSRINVVMYDSEHEKVKKVLENHVQTDRFKIIPVNGEGLDHVFAISEALGKGETVCFQGDRYMDGSRHLTAGFMGHDAKFPLGPFLLASKMKVPVVFYFAMREKGRKYRFMFFSPEMFPCSGTEKNGAERILASYAAALESVVKKYPEQWFNYYDFWD